jgi:tRNA(adenine34) deaminase
MKNDENYMERCLELATKSFKEGDLAFGSLIVCGDQVLAESGNRRNLDQDVTAHAEILVLREVQRQRQSDNLSDCTLYSSCEPCAMCAYMIREYKIKRVVFGVKSPIMGGYSKWPILQDEELENLAPFFSHPPIVVGGVLEQKINPLMLRQQERFR